jgi:hypothetical protein
MNNFTGHNFSFYDEELGDMATSKRRPSRRVRPGGGRALAALKDVVRAVALFANAETDDYAEE